MSALFHYIAHGHAEDRNPHPIFDARFVRSQTRSAVDPLTDYLAAPRGTVQPHPDFDETFVLQQIGGKIRAGETVLGAYLRLERDINPSLDFDCTEYLLSYPDIAELHPFYHYVRWGRGEGRTIGTISRALRGVFAEIEFAAGLDPDIVVPHTDIDLLPRIARLSHKFPPSELMDVLLAEVKPGLQTVVYIINDLVAGGAERVLANLVTAHRGDASIEQVVILSTGGDASEAQAWLPQTGLVSLKLAQQVAVIGSVSQAATVVASFLQLLPVRAVCVINSELGWAMIEAHGEALRACTRLMAGTFCYDFDRFGRRAGYAWTELAHTRRYIDVLITDNAAFARALKQDFRLSEEESAKIRVLYQPAPAPLAAARSSAAAGAKGAPTILWAGRFSRQKRVGLALAIAAMMPEIRFVLAGGSAADIDPALGLLPPVLPANVTFLGRFSDFATLPLQSCQAFLYTSAWDGLPNILLEAAVVGLPIVAPDIGGISELIDDETGWLVSNQEEPGAYVAQLKAVLGRPEAAQSRSFRLFDRLARQHNPDSFGERVRALFAEAPARVPAP